MWKDVANFSHIIVEFELLQIFFEFGYLVTYLVGMYVQS